MDIIHKPRAYTRKHTVQERFWSKVDKTSSPHGCWLWTDRPNFSGYGRLLINNRAYFAHRLSYEWAYGPFPEELCVLHNCPGGDNPLCVNPAHLWLGTRTDNHTDMEKKGRASGGGRIGSAHCMTSLTEADIPVIRRMKAQGMTYTAIAAQIGMTVSGVRFICIRKTWSHVP